ncbi:ABC transporter ATP-binding protein [Tuberibacillus calidus]|jgi:putative ABC transport system ATP-binding protein|uniref:ABC transporter ATP-binding protein n=1 Tax=Tuberibacillus calidus TaxID=340097 RepID=UPI000413C874|nr:ABC transporter ATP-binding protein [Tuberibacillus calidus]
MVIRLKNVTKTYGEKNTQVVALNHVNLTIGKGEFAAVIGKSGSGKSTLLNMITGIDQPTSGTVEILGKNIHRFRRSRLAKWRGKNIGIVFQFFQLMPTLTALENIMLPMDFCRTYTRQKQMERAFELLQQVGMADAARKFPAELSGGEQQRVAIARALANDPPIIVADEPTGSLDSKTADQIIFLFEQLAARGKTVVIVTHDHTLADRADRLITVVDGKVTGSSLSAKRKKLRQKESISR